MIEILVSVIVITFNRAYCLARCLDSIPWRDHQNMEIVIVDDASTDRTIEMLSAYIDRGAPIRLIRLLKNSGVGAARAAGVANSKGHIIMWIDSDDEWLPSSYDLLLTALSAPEQPQVVTGQLVNHLSAGLVWPDWVPVAARNVPIYSSCFGTTAMTRAVLLEHPISDSLRFAEDFEWELRIKHKGVAIQRIEQPVLIRWIGSDNLCHNRSQVGMYQLPVLMRHAIQVAQNKSKLPF